MTAKTEATKRSIPILFSNKGKPKPLTRSIGVLKKATAEGNKIRLNSGQLDRETFSEIKAAFGKLNVKWKGSGKNKDGSPKGYLEIDDRFDAKVLLDAMIEHRIYPSSNATDFFPTPTDKVKDILRYFVEKFDYRTDLKILEPSAGTGGFADVIRELFPDAELDCIEYLPVNAEVLRSKGHNVVHEGDFLQYETDKRYDLIFMNPPFDGTTYVDHVYKAWQLLERYGEMAAIVPETTHNSNDKTANFWSFVGCSGSIEDTYESGTFDHTKIVTQLLFFVNDPDAGTKEYNGFKNFHIWHSRVLLENNLSNSRYFEDGWSQELWNTFERIIKNKAATIEKGDFNPLREAVWKLINRGRKILQKNETFLCLNDSNKADLLDTYFFEQYDFDEFLKHNDNMAEYIPKTYKKRIGDLPEYLREEEEEEEAIKIIENENDLEMDKMNMLYRVTLTDIRTVIEDARRVSSITAMLFQFKLNDITHRVIISNDRKRLKVVRFMPNKFGDYNKETLELEDGLEEVPELTAKLKSYLIENQSDNPKPAKIIAENTETWQTIPDALKIPKNVRKAKVNWSDAKSVGTLLRNFYVQIDDIRTKLQGIKYDSQNGQIIATDAHKIVIINQPTTLNGFLDKTGKEIEFHGSLPDYFAAIGENGYRFAKSINIHKLRSYLSVASNLLGVKHPMPIAFMMDSFPHNAPLDIYHDRHLSVFGVNVSFAQEVCDFFLRVGVEQVNITYSGSILEFFDGKDRLSSTYYVFLGLYLNTDEYKYDLLGVKEYEFPALQSIYDIDKDAILTPTGYVDIETEFPADSSQKADKGSVVYNKDMYLNINKVKERNVELPILDYVAIEDNRLYVTNLETTLSLPILGYKDGIYKAIPNGLFLVKHKSVEDYPNQKEKGDKKVYFKMDARQLYHIFDDLSYSASTDDLRPAMRGIYIGYNKDYRNNIEFCATDAHSLQKRTITTYIHDADKDFDFIVPTPKKMAYLFKKQTGEVTIFRLDGDSDAYFEFEDGMLIRFRPIDALYPDYNAVIPTSYDDSVTFLGTYEITKDTLKDFKRKFNKEKSDDTKSHAAVVYEDGTIKNHHGEDVGIKLKKSNIDFDRYYTNRNMAMRMPLILEEEGIKEPVFFATELAKVLGNLGAKEVCHLAIGKTRNYFMFFWYFDREIERLSNEENIGNDAVFMDMPVSTFSISDIEVQEKDIRQIPKIYDILESEYEEELKSRMIYVKNIGLNYDIVQIGEHTTNLEYHMKRVLLEILPLFNKAQKGLYNVSTLFHKIRDDYFKGKLFRKETDAESFLEMGNDTDYTLIFVNVDYSEDVTSLIPSFLVSWRNHYNRVIEQGLEVHPELISDRVKNQRKFKHFVKTLNSRKSKEAEERKLRERIDLTSLSPMQRGKLFVRLSKDYGAGMYEQRFLINNIKKGFLPVKSENARYGYALKRENSRYDITKAEYIYATEVLMKLPEFASLKEETNKYTQPLNRFSVFDSIDIRTSFFNEIIVNENEVVLRRGFYKDGKSESVSVIVRRNPDNKAYNIRHTMSNSDGVINSFRSYSEGRDLESIEKGNKKIVEELFEQYVSAAKLAYLKDICYHLTKYLTSWEYPNMPNLDFMDRHKLTMENVERIAQKHLAAKRYELGEILAYHEAQGELSAYQSDRIRHQTEQNSFTTFDEMGSLKKIGVESLVPVVKTYQRGFLAIKPIENQKNGKSNNSVNNFQIFFDTDNCCKFVKENENIKYLGILTHKLRFHYFEIDSRTVCRDKILEDLMMTEHEVKSENITALLPIATQMDDIIDVMRSVVTSETKPMTAKSNEKYFLKPTTEPVGLQLFDFNNHFNTEGDKNFYRTTYKNATIDKDGNIVDEKGRQDHVGNYEFIIQLGVRTGYTKANKDGLLEYRLNFDTFVYDNIMASPEKVFFVKDEENAKELSKTLKSGFAVKANDLKEAASKGFEQINNTKAAEVVKKKDMSKNKEFYEDSYSYYTALDSYLYSEEFNKVVDYLRENVEQRDYSYGKVISVFSTLFLEVATYKVECITNHMGSEYNWTIRIDDDGLIRFAKSVGLKTEIKPVKCKLTDFYKSEDYRYGFEESNPIESTASSFVYWLRNKNNLNHEEMDVSVDGNIVELESVLRLYGTGFMGECELDAEIAFKGNKIIKSKSKIMIYSSLETVDLVSGKVEKTLPEEIIPNKIKFLEFKLKRATKDSMKSYYREEVEKYKRMLN